MHSSKNLNSPQSSPTLSVIVPILNEAANLSHLFTTLTWQEGIDFELILVDGGSSDSSVACAEQLATSAPYPCHILHSLRGRACQMNAGAAIATGPYLLFLHVDSLLTQRTALHSGLADLIAAEKSPEGPAVAARFRLAFAPNEKVPQRWRDFHTQKAHQNRRGCIHGDQGFLLSRIFFTQVGPFDESLPFLEDDELSDQIFTNGRWILLPSEIITSARRFTAEGYWQRDLLNLLILTLHQSGYGGWLPALTMAYRANPRGGKVRIKPALLTISTQLKSLSRRERLQFWAAIYRCIRENLWQLRLLKKPNP